MTFIFLGRPDSVNPSNGIRLAKIEVGGLERYDIVLSQAPLASKSTWDGNRAIALRLGKSEKTVRNRAPRPHMHAARV